MTDSDSDSEKKETRQAIGRVKSLPRQKLLWERVDPAIMLPHIVISIGPARAGARMFSL